MKKILLSLLAIVVVAGGAFVYSTWWGKPWTVNLFYTRVLLKFTLRHPETLTQLGFLNGVPFGDWRDKLDDYTATGEEKDRAFVEENIALLHRYDRAKMNADAQLSYDVMDFFLKNIAEGEKFRNYPYVVNQMFGFQNSLPDFMLSTQPLKTPRDAESYVRRAGQMGKAFDDTIERLKTREKAGIVPPRFVLEAVIGEMKNFSDKPAAENEIVTHFVSATDSVKGLDTAKRDDLRKRLLDEVEHGFLPAYGRMLAYLEDQAGRATDEDGVWKLPDGDAYYDFMLRQFTTTNLPADTIHQLGLREVARLQAQMSPLLDEARVAKGTFGSRVQIMRKDPRFGYPPGDSGRAMILARYQEILDDASQRCEAIFNVRPKARLEVQRVPEFKEKGTPAAYYNAPAMDGSRPGIFYANLRDPAETRRPDMRTLAYHEGIPGHHFQLTVAQELKGKPMFRKILPFTAYSEGWGLYAEHVALEHGFHQDAYDSLGALGGELFRAVRLVVDTGIHRKHWTRQQAIDYMVANTGMDSSVVATEINRYVVLPGQACAYKVGQLEILALRQKAEERLGDKFDIRKFHDVVLQQGALPLTLLEQVVDEWIAREESASPAHQKS